MVRDHCIDANEILEEPTPVVETDDVLQCSIKQAEIDVPQLLDDGHIYDRAQICEWASRSEGLSVISPNTGLPATMINSVTVEKLVARVKKDRDSMDEQLETIEEFRAQNEILTESLKTQKEAVARLTSKLAETQNRTQKPYLHCQDIKEKLFQNDRREVQTTSISRCSSEDTEIDSSCGVPESADAWLNCHSISVAASSSSSAVPTASAPWTDDSRRLIMDEMERQNLGEMQNHLDEVLQENLRLKELHEELQDENKEVVEFNAALLDENLRLQEERDNKLDDKQRILLEENKRLKETVEKHKHWEHRRSQSQERRNEQLKRNITKKMRAGNDLTPEENFKRDYFHKDMGLKLNIEDMHRNEHDRFKKMFADSWKEDWLEEMNRQNQFDQKMEESRRRVKKVVQYRKKYSEQEIVKFSFSDNRQ